jgi:hypothetical protein
MLDRETGLLSVPKDHVRESTLHFLAFSFLAAMVTMVLIFAFCLPTIAAAAGGGGIRGELNNADGNCRKFR